MIENDENLREIEQLKLGPMDIEELRILSDERRISIFHRGFCCGTYGVGDNFSRNFFLVQLHESGRIKIKDLARIFGMRYQYCSKIIVDYRKKGIKGIADRRHKSNRNRLLITDKIGKEVLSLRSEEKTYKEISEIIRFRFKKKIKPTALRMWIYERKKQLKEMNNIPSSVVGDLLPEAELVSLERCEVVEGQWVYNIYAGSMVLYAMLCRGEFLKSFVNNLTSNITESWGVKRVLLTLFFLHALRLKSVEQTKHLVGRDFAQIVGGDFLKGQWLRYGVDEVVKQDKFDQAMKVHYQNLISKTYRDDKLYYTDGHFSTYYGKYTVPKGFDPRRQMPYRGRNAIYCHNSNGENVYLFESPTNTTLSQDIEVLVRDLEKHEFGLKGVTLCFDRGGWSQKNFKFLRGKKMYLISYLKNRKKERLIEEALFKQFLIIDDGDEVIYKLYEKEAKETRYGKVRTIILLSEDGKQIPIITTNPYLKPEEVVQILKRRWREENCFKYMIEHFGIDLLTTYKTEEAPDKIIERPHPERKIVNGELTAKKRELEVARALLAKKVFECGEGSSQTIREFYDREKELNFKIKNIQVDIDILERKRQTIPTKEKRSLKEDHVIMAQKRRLLINTVKAVNYNAEKWLQEIFKKYHTKEDETLSMIRNLCRQPGRIYQGEVALKVELQALDNGPMSESLDKVLKNLKENGWLKLPDGRNLEIVQMH